MLHPFSSFCGNCGILPIFEYIRIFEYETEQMSNIQIFKKPILIGHSTDGGPLNLRPENNLAVGQTL